MATEQASFNHQQIDQKWQARWLQEETYRTKTKTEADKEYVLDMFPYPSGEGLHVGHPLGYIGTDILTRYFRAKGKQVLHPMGYDAFGLPAENYAIKTGLHPAESTRRAIKRFRSQMQMIGLSYDWRREINSSDPNYYRWTQWLFLKLYERGLAYRAMAPVNWCPKDQTVLANEQVKEGCCERCGSRVEQKALEQWFFRMTEYADEYLTALDELDWPEPIKLMQRNWIGRSEGAEVIFKVVDSSIEIPVFTTRIDTIFSGTFILLAPDNQLVDKLRSHIKNWNEVRAYRDEVRKKTEVDRQAQDHRSAGIALEGVTAINPATDEPLPVWLADFVLASYGTGAVFADAHDERDFVFAQTYRLPLKISILPTDDRPTKKILALKECFIDDGKLINSAQFNDFDSATARTAITDWLAKKGLARPVTKYRLRDWLVSRQRYWGAPIPMIICQTCGYVPVPENQLPVLLPTDVDFRPTGESPLVRSEEFHRGVTCPECSGPARREVDTMDTFVDSSWYFLRFINPDKNDGPFDSSDVNRWLPVDWYVGGAEHAVLHLLYSRFFTKALADAGFLKFREPFRRLRNQGLIRGEDNRKMSKRWGNVVNPDDVVRTYGADALRCFEMFMGPFDDSKPWKTSGLIGVRRWLDRIWRLQDRVGRGQTDPQARKTLNRTIQEVDRMIPDFQFNTAISQLMIATNNLERSPGIENQDWKKLLGILAPFAPHLANELWERLGELSSLDLTAWPAADRAALLERTLTLPVQVNGKTRATIIVPVDNASEEIIAQAKADPRIASYLNDKIVLKEILVPGRILNIVVR